MAHQNTIKNKIELTGTGLHSGAPVRLVILPAGAGEGIKVRRTDLSPAVEIPATVDFVTETTLATVLGANGAAVSTVEHCLAALRAFGVDNAVIEIDGPEFPILDGSAALYIEKLREVGLKPLAAPRKYLKIQKPVRVECKDKFCILRPYDGFAITYSIDFEGSFPGAQHYYIEVNADSFEKELCRARTFGFLGDVEKLKAIGKARGASLENAIALHEGKVVNPEGLRMPGEMVRHKILDAVGDLALAGYPIEGHLIVHKGGHEMHRRVLAALLASPDAWSLETVEEKVKLLRPRVFESLELVAAAIG
jgi:UDP-3-O-[3-hydroxymyristoyl] N-acetylglucosamine deacetylase